MCANLQGQAFNDDSEILYNLLVQYVGTSVTDSNTVYRHTRSNNSHTYYLELKVNLKTEAYEETKYSKDNAIIQITHYYVNSKFALEHY